MNTKCISMLNYSANRFALLLVGIRSNGGYQLTRTVVRTPRQDFTTRPIRITLSVTTVVFLALAAIAAISLYSTYRASCSRLHLPSWHFSFLAVYQDQDTSVPILAKTTSCTMSPHHLQLCWQEQVE